MNLLATLILAHLIADFPLQTNGIFRLKSTHWLGILLHATVHCLVAAFLIDNPVAHWQLLVSLGVIHFGIDWFKLQGQIRFESLGFVLDQLAHVLSLVVLARWPWSPAVDGLLRPTMLYLAVGYAMLPALLMFLSVLSRDLAQFTADSPPGVESQAVRLRSLSQTAGLPLAVLVMILRLGGRA